MFQMNIPYEIGTDWPIDIVTYRAASAAKNVVQTHTQSYNMLEQKCCNHFKHVDDRHWQKEPVLPGIELLSQVIMGFF